MSTPFDMYFVKKGDIVGKASGNGGWVCNPRSILFSIFEGFEEAINYFDYPDSHNIEWLKTHYTINGENHFDLYKKFFIDKDSLLNFEYVIIPRLDYVLSRPELIKYYLMKEALQELKIEYFNYLHSNKLKYFNHLLHYNLK